ncbi:hypothetical protein SKAU_G00239370 [Synaphobranchus kaupii]|uniref:Interleukin-7 n=1 Tax=Synaphobranchus kaupii TaxID=118154 RepID=A0A9Q1F7P5_SYNKA|nr:hypothetical protein SKAU_G00239370 [Synaphobranchus kaupii]
MMRYTILIFTLLHYSWGDSIYEDVRQDLEKLEEQYNGGHFTFELQDKRTLQMPNPTMMKNPCGCETVFLKNLKMVLENVEEAKDSNMEYKKIISNLLVNLEFKIQKENPSKEKHDCKMGPLNDSRVLGRNIRFIRNRNEHCKM